MNDGFDALQRYYQQLEGIPQPAEAPVANTRPRFTWFIWAPIAASACAYVFLSLCAAGPVDAGPTFPGELLRNQITRSGFALQHVDAPTGSTKTGARIIGSFAA